MLREKNSSYQKKALCEFCEQRHGQADTCDIKIKGVSANSEEGSSKLTLADIFNHMEHKRPIILGVLFKKGTGANLPMLDAEYDESHIKSMQ